MPRLRSATSTTGRNMAGARALWRATGMTSQDFGKPIIAVANSYTGFVPGHVHLKDMGALVCDAIAEYGGIGREFNTIAVDDGIAMGHSGMLYSLPSREIIADSVEYMVMHTRLMRLCAFPIAIKSLLECSWRRFASIYRLSSSQAVPWSRAMLLTASSSIAPT